MFKKILKSKIFIAFILLVAIYLVGWFWPAKPSVYDYGVTFSSKYVRQLSLDPQKVFDAMTDDLGVKKVRLVAYWDEIERDQDKYDFSDLDWQLQKAKEKDLEVILSLGRRVPRWPECHIPGWARTLEWKNQKEELLIVVRDIVNRYKDNPAIKIWQVENEPFLTAYVPELCGSSLDKVFFEREIALVKTLDPSRPVLTTDSGNVGLWAGAYKRGDMFGSTFYVYLNNPKTGEVRTIVNQNFYKFKRFISQTLYGKKPTYLIEVSLEPWLNDAIERTPIEIQIAGMGIDRIKEILKVAAKTNFDEQYLWGVEWWYSLKEKGYPEIWDFMKKEVWGN